MFIILTRVDEVVSDGKPPAGKGVKIVCKAACTFEFVLQFVRCDTVTVSPNQIIIIIIIIIIINNLHSVVRPISHEFHL